MKRYLAISVAMQSAQNLTQTIANVRCQRPIVRSTPGILDVVDTTPDASLEIRLTTAQRLSLQLRQHSVQHFVMQNDMVVNRRTGMYSDERKQGPHRPTVNVPGQQGP